MTRAGDPLRVAPGSGEPTAPARERSRADELTAHLLTGLFPRLLALLLGAGTQCRGAECAYGMLASGLVRGGGYKSFRGHLWAPGYASFLARHGFAASDFANATKVMRVLLSAEPGAGAGAM